MILDEINIVCAELSEDEQKRYLSEQIDIFLEEQEELKNLELMRQYEMMSRALDLEDFSPFDTFNS
jgi:hypothetical protein